MSVKRIDNLKEKTVYKAEIQYLHCLKTNTRPTFLKVKDSRVWATFPPNSFVNGALYPLDLNICNDLGGAEFMIYYSNII